MEVLKYLIELSKSKTIRTAALSFVGLMLAAFMADPDVLAVINQHAAWALPFLMVILRLVTKGPVGKKEGDS